MQRFNVNLFPTGGWTFKDTDGVVLVSDTYRFLVARVVDYRRRRGAAIGDVEAEIHVQLCQKNPGRCHDEYSGPMPAPGGRKAGKSLKVRVLEWLAALTRHEVFHISDTEMEQRRAICRGCPHNVEIAPGCRPCAIALKGLRAKLLGHRPPPTDLNGCQILSQDLPTAVWLSDAPVDNPALPSFCWKKWHSR